MCPLARFTSSPIHSLISKESNEDWGNTSHRRRNGSNLFSRTEAKVQSLSARESWIQPACQVKRSSKKNLAKETEILQTEAAKFGRSVKLTSVKVSFPKALLSMISQFILILGECNSASQSVASGVGSCPWFHKPHQNTERSHCRAIGSRCPPETDAC